MSKLSDSVDPALLRGIIKHKFSAPKYSALARVTRVCVTDAIMAEPELTTARTVLGATATLQRAVRAHYLQAITFNKEQALRYTYDLNCPPSTFHVTPYTNLCQNSRVCPWCFSRRMFEVFRVLTKPPNEIRKSSMLWVWRRDFDTTSELPFLPSTRGPHDWLDALVTVQLMLPVFNPHTRSFQLRHIGFQVIPKTTTKVVSKLNQKTGKYPLNIRNLPSCTHANILKAFQATAKIPWMTLYHPDNFPYFIDLLGMFPRQQLLRISRYKPKGDLHGDRLTTVSKGLNKPGTTVLDTECPF